MFFKIERKIIERVSGIYTGVIVAYGLDNVTKKDAISNMLQNEIQKARIETENVVVKEMPELKPYQEAMRCLGINSSKYPCSLESILNRIAKKGEFSIISPIVDMINYISLKYRVPVGVHDINTLKDDLIVRFASKNDCLNNDNSINNDSLKVGEPVCVSGDSVRTRRWIWRQTDAGRIAEDSADCIFLIDGFSSNKDIVDNACLELQSLIRDYFNVIPEAGFVDSKNTEFGFGSLSKEQWEIENQIAVMLKGVAQHTEVSEIRKRLIEAKCDNRPLRIKLGLDPSAPDIHIGHSVVLRKIRQLQDLGHIAVIIIGDYTGMIGDPTGKSKTRKQLTREEVEHNANTYMEQIFKIVDRTRTEVYYNSDWLSKMSFGDVIELSAKCTVARMLERDDFYNRYTNHLPLSVHEFFYPLMQAYDSVAINADIELGGTDQTFNILLGRNIQRDYGQKPQLTLFMPLLEGIDGVEKMSKSLGNYIGISEEPSVIYEKVMKIPDNLIIKYYNLCTDVHPDDIITIQHDLNQGANPRDIKMMLAHEITELYAGKNAAEEAEQHFRSVYQKNQIPNDAPILWVDLEKDIPHGEAIVKALIDGDFYKSKSEIRRIFSQGGVQINGKKVTDVSEVTIAEDECILRIGKSKFFRVKRA